MITITKKYGEKILENGSLIQVELAGLALDEKPTEIGSKQIENGSTLIEMDTGKIYFFDAENQEWKEV